MKMIYVLGITLLAVISIYCQYNLNEDESKLLEEKFVYDVSWTIFHLGTISITVERVISNPDLRKITLDVKTAPLLPFIDIDEHNLAIMRVHDGMTMHYYGIEEQDGVKVEIESNYYEDEMFTVYEVRNFETGETIKKDTLTFSKPYLVGTSLIHYTRLIADSGLKFNVPTLLGGKFYNTNLNFCGPIEYMEIDEFDEPIRTFRYKGLAEWDGKATAGLSGEFIGWLSDDEGSVVIGAEMKIFLGSIEVELVEWHKPGWIPPTEKNLVTKTN